MPITIACPNCKQMCAVADEHAGQQVRCPHCTSIINVPGVTAAAVPLSAVPPPPPPPFTPPPAGAVPDTAFSAASPPAGKSAFASLDEAARIVGLDQLGKILVLAGTGCLVMVVVFVISPWYSAGGEIFHLTLLGISTSAGLMTLLISLELLFALVFFFFLSKNSEMFHFALLAAAWWGVHLTLWRLIDILHSSGSRGWGLYVEFIFSLGVAGSFGVVAVQRMTARK